MAYRKVDETSLTNIANAIRAKSGKAGSLTFPDGFISAIQSIETFPIPKVNLANGVLYAYATSAYYTPITVTDGSINFYYYGGSGCEQILFPITGLLTGITYELTFEETYNGGFIGDTYQYGCGIMTEAEYNSTAFPSNSGKISQVTWTIAQTGTHGSKLTFKATSNKAYWIWNMSRCNDNTKHNITFKASIKAV